MATPAPTPSWPRPGRGRGRRRWGWPGRSPSTTSPTTAARPSCRPGPAWTPWAATWTSSPGSRRRSAPRPTRRGRRGGGGGGGGGGGVVLAKSNTADAEVEDGAGLSDVGNLTIDATSTQTETATVEAGSAGGIALTPAAAVIVSSDLTTARLGTA